MSVVRVDPSYKRNQICPCERGQKHRIKIKRCCTHLLQAVSNRDLNNDERHYNGEANAYVQTAAMLKQLPCPDEDSKYQATMTCGCCLGRGDRPKHRSVIGRPAPERVKCESCDGDGWYIVNVSHPVPLEEERL